MALNNYEALKAEIISHLDRDDLVPSVDTFIDLAEARHKRDVRIREMVERDQFPVSTRYLALPDGFLQMQTLRLVASPYTVLKEVNLHEMNRRRRDTNGQLRLFTIYGDEIEFDVSPDAPIDVEMVYYKALTPLSDTDPVNALLIRAPDAYLYAALAASAPFLHDDERVQSWESGYNNAVAALGITDRRARFAGPLFSAISGPTP